MVNNSPFFFQNYRKIVEQFPPRKLMVFSLPDARLSVGSLVRTQTLILIAWEKVMPRGKRKENFERSREKKTYLYISFFLSFFYDRNNIISKMYFTQNLYIFPPTKRINLTIKGNEYHASSFIDIHCFRDEWDFISVNRPCGINLKSNYNY